MRVNVIKSIHLLSLHHMILHHLFSRLQKLEEEENDLLACYLIASGGQSDCLLGWAAVKAGWCSKWRSILRIVGKGFKLTWNFRALYICGTKQQSANVISSPIQYLLALDDNNFSIAEKQHYQCLLDYIYNKLVIERRYFVYLRLGIVLFNADITIF